MAARGANGRPRYFYSLLIKIVFLIIVTVLILSFILNANFNNYSINLLNTSNEKLINQVFHNALQTDQNVRTLTQALFRNPDTANLMYGENLLLVDEVKSIRQLDSIFGSMSFVQSAYIYNGRTDTYYTFGSETLIRRRTLYDRELDEMLRQPKGWSVLSPLPRNVASREMAPYRMERAFTYVLPEYFADTGRVKNALVVNIRMDWVFNTLSSYQEKASLAGNHMLIMNGTGQVVAQSDPNGDLFLQQIEDRPFAERILQSEDPSGAFLSDDQGEPALITYARSPESPWIFVDITPYRYIADQVARMKRITLAIEVFIFIVSVLIAALLARNLYAPVRRLSRTVGQFNEAGPAPADGRNEFTYIEESFQTTRSKLARLESFRKTNLGALKQKHLEDLLHGYAGALPDESFYKERMIAIDPRSSMTVVLFVIDRYDDFRKQYTPKDQSLLKYALQNMADEIVQPHFRCELLEAGGANVVMLLNTETEDAEKERQTELERLKSLIGEVQGMYAKYCQMTVSAFLSLAGPSVRDIPALFRQTLDLSRYRIKYGHGCLLTQYDMERFAFADFTLDDAVLAKLLDALKKGKREEVAASYDSLIDSLSNCRYNNMMFALSYVLSSIFNTINLMERNGTISFALDFVSFDNRIKTMETLEQINAVFLELFERIVEKIEQHRGEKSELVVSSAKQYIEANYRDGMLSAQSVADRFKLTPPYLNKLFREYAACSIADYISEYRLLKAAELLETTSFNIDEVLERVGWENKKHFFTLFKRRFAATPTEYRLKSTVAATHRLT